MPATVRVTLVLEALVTPDLAAPLILALVALAMADLAALPTMVRVVLDTAGRVVQSIMAPVDLLMTGPADRPIRAPAVPATTDLVDLVTQDQADAAVVLPSVGDRTSDGRGCEPPA